MSTNKNHNGGHRRNKARKGKKPRQQRDLSLFPPLTLVFSQHVCNWEREHLPKDNAKLYSRITHKTLDNDGNAVPVSRAFETGSKADQLNLERYMRTYQDAVITAENVREVRAVEALSGKPLNKQRWQEWGYMPEVN